MQAMVAKRRVRRFVPLLLQCAVVAAAAFFSVARAQAQAMADGADGVDVPLQGALVAELEQLVNSPPPAGGEALALCIHHHRRGNALGRLGRTDEALADFRQALARDARWLIRRLAIAQQSSASSFLALRQRGASLAQRKDFIGFGDPLFLAGTRAGAGQGQEPAAGRPRRWLFRVSGSGGGKPISEAFTRLAPLPDTQLELADIASAIKADPANDLFLGARATEGNVKRSRLHEYRILAFATHGLVPGELVGLDQPALALSNPLYSADPENDGLLTLEEVLGLRLDADWVLLSACNTGSSDRLQGEAVSGLGRSFFFAGAA